MKIELELKPATDPPKDARFVIMFKANVDGRGVTKSYFGYYDGEEWMHIDNTKATNISHYAERPKPFDDIKP